MPDCGARHRSAARRSFFDTPNRDKKVPHPMSDSQMDEQQQRDVAAKKVLEAMQSAIDEGVEPDVVKLVTLSAAVTNFVNDYGEEATAGIIESLPEKVRNGAFSQPSADSQEDGGDGQ
jgi:hypothetical protein